LKKRESSNSALLHDLLMKIVTQRFWNRTYSFWSYISDFKKKKKKKKKL